MKLKGKSIVVTGANQGFGLAVARAFASAGASLVLTARNLELLNQEKSKIEAEFRTPVIALQADASQQGSNDKMAQAAIDAFGRIDVFVANAGVYGPKGAIESVDWQEWCDAIDINLKGVILGCRSVLPHMKKSRRGKIIILSGGGATKPMPFLSAYAVSKAGAVRFMETLAGEVGAFKIDVNAVAPGALNTKLLDEVLAAGPELVGDAFYQQSMKQKASGGTPLQKGSDLCMYLASPESDGVTGKLISAVWDPWESFGQHLKELQSTDIYTLRRIVPEDRNIKL